MSGTKRLAEDMSSSDDDCVFLFEKQVTAGVNQELQTPAVNPNPQEHEPASNNDSNKKRKTEFDSFLQFLDSNIPSRLLSAKPSEYLVDQANQRLDQAREDNIDLKSISIGPDCLPTWDGFYWDSEKDQLHAHVQHRLLNFEVSREISFLRDHIVNASAKRLEEARILGLGLNEVWIGYDLLPSWGESVASDDDMQFDSDNSSHTAFESRSAASDISDTFSQTPEEVSQSTTLTSVDIMEVTRVVEETESVTSTNSTEEDDAFDDIIAMANFIDEESCSYEDADNILHDAEIVDAPPGFADVDLEVFLLDGDDSDLDDMPEIEMGIDRAGFEFCYDTDDAVDVEMPGMEIRCSTDLPLTAEQEEHVKQETNRQEQLHQQHLLEEQQKQRQRDLRKARRAERLAATNAEPTSAMVTEVQYSTDSDASEEVTSDEEAGVAATIQETVDGFIW